MPRPMRNCKTCGKEFESSPNDSTVNCPSCRKRPYARVHSSSSAYGQPKRAHMKCSDCGADIYTLAERNEHRRETGHTHFRIAKGAESSAP